MLRMARFYKVTCFVLLLASCGVKDFPAKTPFVFQNNIEIKENPFNPIETKTLKEKLNTQLADSMQVKIKERFIFFKQRVHPAAFDTTYVQQSLDGIKILFKSLGYYNSTCTAISKTDTVRNQYRVTTQFTVHPGKTFRVDSIAYIFTDSIDNEHTLRLQQLALENRGTSPLQKNAVFNETLISDELNRLVSLFRNNGYYNFTRDLLYVDADTVFMPLLNAIIDPFERLKALQDAYERRENPTINLIIRLSPLIKPGQLVQYYIGKVSFYPDYNGLSLDTGQVIVDEKNNVHIKQKKNLFKPAYIYSHNYLKPGTLFNTQILNRTFDEFTGLGSWQFVKIDSKASPYLNFNSTDTPRIDFEFLMMPVKKYGFSADLESVFNQTQQVAIGAAGNLVGLGLNLGVRNRNFDKQGIVIAHTIRGGIEAGIGQINRGLQATELTYSNSVTIPKLLGWNSRINQRFLFKRTFLNSNVSLIDRNVNANGLFRLTNIGSSFGWQIRTKKDEIITFRPAYIEYVNLYNISPSFQKQLDTTPFLRYSFSQGMVLGNFMFSYAKPQIFSKRKLNHISSFRFSFEESGLLFGRFRSSIPLLQRDLFEYVKGEMELKYEIRQPKTTWAFRMLTGAGILLDGTSNMPFFKQFTGGGPNSMRAWPLRSIGPGSSPAERREGRNQFFSRSGDMIFETNAEFRYNIATVLPNTFIIRGAVFTDIGNIWNLPNKTNRNNDTVVFHLRNFYRDLSVSAGAGIRFDFIGLFLLRIDFGLRIKDPALPFSDKNNGWKNPKPSLANFFSNKEEHRQWRYENFNLSLGINYPF